MKRYEVVESRRWAHNDGRTASIYGAVPYSSDADAAGWLIITTGWTVRDTKLGTVGCLAVPFGASRSEAQQVADRFNAIKA